MTYGKLTFLLTNQFSDIFVFILVKVIHSAYSHYTILHTSFLKSKLLKTVIFTLLQPIWSHVKKRRCR